ncbi:RteC domain-containing protein [Algoriphagus sp. A40]|uniref:RteC domain-containing protein n=1 Tax=Algoriphagus sp. A40 TaxID=1945863 RepID=UPI00098528AB|nr:RteC domain-containing protein [Algoriphagus sp. A40]OOG76440.1 hypothetical protein B0E43_08085 [Algoriphagus sp. A40]
MKAFAEKLLEEMEKTLNQLARESSNELQKAERCGKAVNTILIQLREYMTGYQFGDQEDEILFFKYYKPLFFKELIFYSELAYLESSKPVGEKEKIKIFYHHVVDQYQDFFARNHQLYIYHQLERDDLDGQFFLRNSKPLNLIPDYSVDFDPLFSTPNSSKLAKIMALEEMIEHIRRKIDQLELGVEANSVEKSKHRWTDSKSALIELAYALHSRGAVNHGKSDVKMIIKVMESLFDVQVGNFYRTFQSMRIRKKNRTIFLDSLKDSLEKRMDETDMGY